MDRMDALARFGQAGASNPAKEATLMKLNPTAMGNALGGATAVLFALCAVFVGVARDASITFLKAIVHGVDLTPLTTTPKAFNFGSFALGWVGMSIFLWVFGWLLGTIYNASTRRGGGQP